MSEKWMAAGRAMTSGEVESFARRGAMLSIVLLWCASMLKATSSLAYPALSKAELKDVDASLTGRVDGGFVFLHQGLVQAVIVLSLTAAVWALPVRFPKHGGVVLLAALASSAATVASCLWGVAPAISPTVAGPILLITALFLLPRPDIGVVLAHVRSISLVYVYGSLLTALMAPRYAVLLQYDASFIGLPIRLNGLTAHANQLGGVCVIALICVIGRRLRFGRYHLWAIAVCLVLTQSKTSIVAALLALAVVSIRVESVRSRQMLVLVGLLVVASAAMLLVSLTENQLGLDPRQWASVQNLTGREAIWQVSLYVSSENPIFGYGPKLWGEEMRVQYSEYLGFAPPHAHNQAVQSLSTSGIVGLCATLLFAVSMAVSSWRVRRLDGCAALAIFMSVVVVRSFSEVTLDMRTLSDTNMMAGFIVLALLFGGRGVGAADHAAQGCAVPT